MVKNYPASLIWCGRSRYKNVGFVGSPTVSGGFRSTVVNTPASATQLGDKRDQNLEVGPVCGTLKTLVSLKPIGHVWHHLPAGLDEPRKEPRHVASAHAVGQEKPPGGVRGSPELSSQLGSTCNRTVEMVSSTGTALVTCPFNRHHTWKVRRGKPREDAGAADPDR
jgi:hypothetical protein